MYWCETGARLVSRGEAARGASFSPPVNMAEDGGCTLLYTLFYVICASLSTDCNKKSRRATDKKQWSAPKKPGWPTRVSEYLYSFAKRVFFPAWAADGYHFDQCGERASAGVHEADDFAAEEAFSLRAFDTKANIVTNKGYDVIIIQYNSYYIIGRDEGVL